MTVCPNCWIAIDNDRDFIQHRFNELRDWFVNCDESHNADLYARKNPDDYQLVDGIIERKVP